MSAPADHPHALLRALDDAIGTRERHSIALVHLDAAERRGAKVEREACDALREKYQFNATDAWESRHFAQLGREIRARGER